MKEDVKKRFLDILFEPEETEQEVKVSEHKTFDGSKTLKAKELLYAKSNGFKEKESVSVTKTNSSFINLEEPKPTEIKQEYEFIEKQNDDYKIKQSISPMFGFVKKDENIVISEKPVVETLKPNKKSYLGTIMSPFFGIDQKNDYSNTMSLSINKIEKEENLMDEIKNKNDNNNLLDLLNDNDDVTKEDFHISNLRETQRFVETAELKNENIVSKDVNNINDKEIVEEEKLDNKSITIDENQNELEPVFADDEAFIADSDEKIPVYDEMGEDFARFKEHTGDTEEIDLLQDLFSEEE